ncbi:MAG: DUF3025 domain-containing protein [Hydrogenophilales bacterium]|nr:DUF3025 domain-containing protein [Hydrogenophilales bacterium]
MTVVWDMAQVQASPLFAALHPVLAQADWPSHAWPALADYQALLDKLPQPVMTAGGARLRVAPQASEKPDDWRQGYEPRIYLRGELQTRAENWHDVFNLLVWATFPRAKAALNARHYALLEARAGLTTLPRLPSQDALTQFDETGVVIVSADETLSDLLQSFQWKRLFCERRSELQVHMHCYLFGHGLMEKALTPYRGMTGKGIVLPVAPAFFAQTPARQMAQMDERLARLIADPQKLAMPHDLAPVPVLGFPGFTPENENPAYYEDQAYFRPGRGAAL